MFNVGGSELLVIFLVALIVLGPDKLPKAAKQAGQFMAQVRKMSDGFRAELKSAMDDVIETDARTEGAKLSKSEEAEPELHEVKAVADPEVHLDNDAPTPDPAAAPPTTGDAPTVRPDLRTVKDDDGTPPDVAAAG